MAVTPPIFVITGQLAAGKSTLARALLERFPFGFEVDVDRIREMVTSGFAGPLRWTDETTRQFALAVEGSVALASVYRRGGFAVAIEGAIDPSMVDEALRAAALEEGVVRVELHPPLDVALARNRDRGSKPFDPAILEPAMRAIDADIRAAGVLAGWTRLDNGGEPVEATVERILALDVR